MLSGEFCEISKNTFFTEHLSGRLLPDILILLLSSDFTDVLIRNIDKALSQLYSKVVVKDYSDDIAGLINTCFKRMYKNYYYVKVFRFVLKKKKIVVIRILFLRKKYHCKQYTHYNSKQIQRTLSCKKNPQKLHRTHA